VSAHHHTRHPLNASRVRARKRALAARDGAWCTYCGRLFADLRQATIDHVVPLSLFHTWRAEHTVLACAPCNQAKADKLPVLLALLILARHGNTPTGAHAPESADAHGIRATAGRVFAVGMWLSLARVCTAFESAIYGPASPDPNAPESGRQSKADLPVFLHVRTDVRTLLTPLPSAFPARRPTPVTSVTTRVTPPSHPHGEAA